MWVIYLINTLSGLSVVKGLENNATKYSVLKQSVISPFFDLEGPLESLHPGGAG